MRSVIDAVERAITLVKFRDSDIPRDAEVNVKAQVVRSQFEGANTVGSRSRVLYSSLGYGSYVANDSELLTTKVGRFCSIGPNVKMPTGIHPVSEFATTSPMFYSKAGVNRISFVDEDLFAERKYAKKPFSRVIGSDVWIGGGCTVLEGVTIGDGAVIGAGALVTKSLPPYSVCLGIPAKVVRLRYDEETVSRLLAARWWEKDVVWLREHAGLFSDTRALLQALEKGD